MIFYEEGGRLVDQHCCVGACFLRGTHWDSFVPEGGPLPKFNSFGGALDSFLSQMVFLYEENLGGGESEAIQAFIFFGLWVSPLKPLTLREAMVIGFSIITEAIPGGWVADRSRDPCGVTWRDFLVAVLPCYLVMGGGNVVRPRGHQHRDVELGEALFVCRLRRGLDTRHSVLGLLVG